ncbi:MAG: heavy-metal-associated domain-containing protein [Bacteroidales bacterium]
MNILKNIVNLSFCLLITFNTQAATKLKSNEAIIILQSEKIDCHSCKAKIEKTIPFEKGVEDLSVDIKRKSVTIKYRTDKTDVDLLQKSLEKIGYPTTIISGNAITH